MPQEPPETVRLTKDAKEALKVLIAQLQSRSPVRISRNAAINWAIIKAVKLKK